VSFQSFHFAVFFAVVFTTVHFVTRKNEHRKIFLLGASYYFYMWTPLKTLADLVWI